MNQFFDIPAYCKEDALPLLENCLHAPVYDSQICSLVIFPRLALKPSDWTNPESWNGLIENSDTTGTKAKYLVVEGDLKEEKKVNVSLPKGIDRTFLRIFSLSVTIKTLDDLTYNYLRAFQCGETNFSFFFETLGQKMYGIEGGIIPTKTDCLLPLKRGVEDVEEGNIEFLFYAQHNPQRINTPLSQIIQSELYWQTPDGNFWQTPGGDFWQFN